MAHYGHPGVADACLQLQDDHGLDVNVILTCLWWERCGGAPLGLAQLNTLLAQSAAMRAEVQAIRTRRRAAKRAGELDRASALARTELHAENRVQRCLFDSLGTPDDGLKGSGRASLEHYLSAYAAGDAQRLVEVVLTPQRTR